MNCITIQLCIMRQWAGEKDVSRYNYCIVTKAGQALGEAGRAGARRQALGSAGGCAGRAAGAQAARRACHAPDTGPTRLANPNRFRGAKPYTGTPYLFIYFFKTNNRLQLKMNYHRSGIH